MVNTRDLTEHPARLAAGYPIVKGHCPACGLGSLFLAAGGYVTCAALGCPNPAAATEVLDGMPTP